MTAQQMGSSLGTAALVAVAGSVSTAGAGVGAAAGIARTLDGYHTAYLTIACCVLVGAVPIALLPGRRRSRSWSDAPATRLPKIPDSR